ncbi:hypothetical protein HJFPF1_11678 [Paramyrothecium foliicola]|nr:hypothetical protein HJFPF1_11678 [Paramyrothecium foliicola]
MPSDLESNMPIPTRRPSTGGLPPIKCRAHYVVEEAPSHDNTPCFTAWMRDEIVNVPQGWSTSDFSIRDRPPPWSIQIYDTTPHADNPSHLKDLAESIHRETREQREAYCRGLPDRIDVFGLPLAANRSDEEIIETCKTHASAEITSRNSENAEYRIPPLKVNWQWHWAIIIIDRPQRLWDEDEGGFLVIHWDLKREARAMLLREYGEDYQVADFDVQRCTRVELGEVLAIMRGDMSQDPDGF